MFITEKMNETNVEGIAELEKENFSDGWSLNSLKEEINNSQSNLAIACPVYKLTKYERDYALVLGNLKLIVFISCPNPSNA